MDGRLRRLQRPAVPLHDLEHGQSLGVLYTASAIALGALFWVIVCAVLAGT